MVIQNRYDLSKSSTFGLKANSKYYVQVTDYSQLGLVSDFIEEVRLPSINIGGGSNIIFCSDYPGVVVKSDLSSIERLDSRRVRVDSGVELDRLVQFSIGEGLSGLEALSGIPGCVGGALALNAGAYGCNISELVESIRAYDLHDRVMRSLTPADLRYWHRSSIFREARGNNLFIVDATLKLSKEFRVAQHHKLENADLANSASIRQHILALRSHLPDPYRKPNCGSFFLNPTITNHQADRLLIEFNDMVMRDYGKNHKQISAGWLLDNLGVRGKEFGCFKFIKKHANVVVAKPGASGRDLAEFITIVKIMVMDKYKISLSVEPLLIGEEFWQGHFIGS